MRPGYREGYIKKAYRVLGLKRQFCFFLAYTHTFPHSLSSVIKATTDHTQRKKQSLIVGWCWSKVDNGWEFKGCAQCP
jgi:hypothetical protein